MVLKPASGSYISFRTLLTLYHHTLLLCLIRLYCGFILWKNDLSSLNLCFRIMLYTAGGRAQGIRTALQNWSESQNPWAEIDIGYLRIWLICKIFFFPLSNLLYFSTLVNSVIGGSCAFSSLLPYEVNTNLRFLFL